MLPHSTASGHPPQAASDKRHNTATDSKWGVFMLVIQIYPHMDRIIAHK